MTTIQFLDTLPLKAKTYWYAFWWIETSFAWLNDAIDTARKENRQGDAESLCKVIALKHLYLSKEQK